MDPPLQVPFLRGALYLGAPQVWLPLGLTILLLRFAIRLMDRSLLLLPPQYRPDAILGFHIPGLGAILTVILLLITGVLAANFVGRWVRWRLCSA